MKAVSLSLFSAIALFATLQASAQYIATSDDNFCAGEVVDLYVNVTPWYGDPNDADPSEWGFAWFPLSLFEDPFAQSVSFEPTESVVITVSCLAPTGEVIDLEISLDVYSEFTVDAGLDVMECTTDGIQLEATADSPANVSWQWTPAAGLSDATISNPLITGNIDQSYTVVATVTEVNGEGCSASDELEVEAIFWEFDLGDVQAACTGESLVIASGLPANYAHDWTFDVTAEEETGTFIEVGQTGTVFLTATSPEGCIQSDELQVIFTDGPVLMLDAPTEFCEGTGVTVDATPVDDITGPFGYAWTETFSGTPLSAGASVHIDVTGDYSVSVSDAAGCITQESFSITGIAAPEIDLPADTVFCFEDYPEAVFLLHAPSGYAGYNWAGMGWGDVIEVESAGTYALTVTNSLGCTASASTRVQDFCAEPLLFVPSAFTPDGDGLNETLKIQGRNLVDLDFVLMNRWGDEVWRAQEVGAYWHAKGPSGTHYVQDQLYVWQAKYRHYLNPEGDLSTWRSASGRITILR
jgi:hypothetical protein